MDHADSRCVMKETEESKRDAGEIVPHPECFKKKPVSFLL